MLKMDIEFDPRLTPPVFTMGYDNIDELMASERLLGWYVGEGEIPDFTKIASRSFYDAKRILIEKGVEIPPSFRSRNSNLYLPEAFLFNGTLVSLHKLRQELRGSHYLSRYPTKVLSILGEFPEGVRNTKYRLDLP